MFGVFSHPKPVTSRRPVAELSVERQQPTSSLVARVFRVTADRAFVSPHHVANMEPVSSPAVRFSVSYSLAEYLSFVHDHMATEMADRARVKGKVFTRLPLAARLLATPIAAVMFAMKKRRMPVCHFTVSSDRILRVSKDGDLSFAWADVVKVHRYSQGFLVAKRSGAVPIPYRCLSDVQLAAVESLISRWERSRGES